MNKRYIWKSVFLKEKFVINLDRGGFNSWSILSTVITSKKNKNVFPLLTQTCHLQIKLNKRDESNEISLEWFSEKEKILSKLRVFP